MADPFTSASATYIAAQRTNQGGGKGWSFEPAKPRSETPVWMVLFIAVAVPAVALSLWVMS